MGVLMKKGLEYIGIIERVDFPNRGIVKVEEEEVVVKGVISGQKIRFVINKNKKGKPEGRLLEVLEKSPLEKEESVCLHFNLCGGCSYQTLPYEEQLKLKLEQVKRLLNQVISKEYPFEGINESPFQWGYRNKMEFSFGDEVKDGPLALGLHKRGSFYDIVSVTNCKIVHDDYNKILKCILELCKAKELTYFHRVIHTGYLRHLLIRRAEKTGDILINLITTSQWVEKGKEDKEEKFLEEYVSCLLNLSIDGKIVGILHTRNNSLADVVQSDRTDILYGQDYIYEELLGLKFKISTFSFFQTNSLGAEVLYSIAREFVGETRDKVIFDLYSGTGTIAQLIATVAKKVVGVEIVEQAVNAAKENAILNAIVNCEFIAGDVLKVIEELKDKPDLIILDPPRDGVNPKALSKIIDYGVKKIVYISCKPTSLARDLVILQERGYQVEKVKCIDMFPGAQHVETIVLLCR